MPTVEEREKILKEFHQLPTGGHLGINRTFERMKLYTSWPGMKLEIENCLKHLEIFPEQEINSKEN